MYENENSLIGIQVPEATVNQSAYILDMTWCYNNFTCPSGEQDKVVEYLNQNYPEIYIEIQDKAIFLVRGDVLIDAGTNSNKTIDEKLSIEKEIREKFPFTDSYYWWNEDIVNSFTYAGDVDYDNRLTADDASYVLEYYAKAQTDKLGEYEESKVSELALYGDYDGDGIVDANDASNILAVYSKYQAK